MPVELPPLGRVGADDLERVQPQRLDLDRLADPGRHHPVADLGVHPGQLHAGHARGEQTVLVHLDPVAGAGAIAGHDPADRGAQRGHGRRRHRRARRLQELVHRDHVPERGVDRVELGHVARIRKPVRDHALRDGLRPGEQDVMGELETVRQGHEAAQGDEGVAAPVGEPGVARDDRPAMAPLHDIGIGRLLQGCREALAPPRLEVGQAGGVDLGVGLAGREHQGRLAAVERPGEDPGRGQVLDEVEAALALTIILEVAVPDRLLAVAAIRRDRRDRRDARIGPPEHAGTRDLGREREARVLMVQRMVVAAREQRPHRQARRLVGRGGGRGPNPVRTDQRPRQQPPADDHVAPAMAGHDLLAHQGPVLGAKSPLRPGLGAELDDPRLAVGPDHIRRIALRAQRKAAARGLEPDLEPVDQHDPAGRRRGRRQQQRVVAPRPGAAHGAGGKAAKAIGLEPLGIEQGGGQRFGHRLGPPALPATRR